MDTTTQQTMAGEKPKAKRGRATNGARLEKMQAVTKMVQAHPEMSVRDIAAGAGVSKTTAMQYLAKWGINKVELDDFVDNRVDIVRSKQQLILDAITPGKIEKATFKDLTVGYGILLDKDRLESGQSTINMASIVSIATRAEELKDVTPVSVTP